MERRGLRVLLCALQSITTTMALIEGLSWSIAMGKTMRERGKGVLLNVSCNISRSNHKEWPTITCMGAHISPLLQSQAIG
jgi:hypothetical protein